MSIIVDDLRDAAMHPLAHQAADEIEQLEQELSGSNEAYALLFKENGKLRSLVELIFASTQPYKADGEPTLSDEVIKTWNELSPNAAITRQPEAQSAHIDAMDAPDNHRRSEEARVKLFGEAQSAPTTIFCQEKECCWFGKAKRGDCRCITGEREAQSAPGAGAVRNTEFDHLVGRGMHELRNDELASYLSSVAINYGPHSDEFFAAANWVVSELERKTNDERILAVQLDKLRSAPIAVQEPVVEVYLAAELAPAEPVHKVSDCKPAPQGVPSKLPKWIDNAKGKDPFMDDVIQWIERNITTAPPAKQAGSELPIGYFSKNGGSAYAEVDPKHRGEPDVIALYTSPAAARQAPHDCSVCSGFGCYGDGPFTQVCVKCSGTGKAPIQDAQQPKQGVAVDAVPDWYRWKVPGTECGHITKEPNASLTKTYGEPELLYLHPAPADCRKYCQLEADQTAGLTQELKNQLRYVMNGAVEMGWVSDEEARTILASRAIGIAAPVPAPDALAISEEVVERRIDAMVAQRLAIALAEARAEAKAAPDARDGVLHPYMIDARLIAKHYASASLHKDGSPWQAEVRIYFSDNDHAEFAFEVLSVALSAGVRATLKSQATQPSAEYSPPILRLNPDSTVDIVGHCKLQPSAAPADEFKAFDKANICRAICKDGQWQLYPDQVAPASTLGQQVAKARADEKGEL